jgi:hypothetical protein
MLNVTAVSTRKYESYLKGKIEWQVIFIRGIIRIFLPSVGGTKILSVDAPVL